VRHGYNVVWRYTRDGRCALSTLPLLAFCNRTSLLFVYTQAQHIFRYIYALQAGAAKTAYYDEGIKVLANGLSGSLGVPKIEKMIKLVGLERHGFFNIRLSY